MGYNSTIVICNDAWSSIDKDPAGWWAKTKEELSKAADGAPREYGFGCNANGFWAAGNHHADNVSVFTVGGNMVTKLGEFHGRWRQDPEDILFMLGEIAGYAGRRLVRMKSGRAAEKALRDVSWLIKHHTESATAQTDYFAMRAHERVRDFLKSMAEAK